MHGSAGTDVTTYIALLIVVALVAVGVRFIRAPYTVALVVAGLALALLPGVPTVSLTPSVILTVFLPALLFYGAYNLDFADLRANLASVALLALPGVAVTVLAVGLAMRVFAGFTWTDGLLLGAIVAATDPVAVLAILGEVGAPRRLGTIIAGESLFNDGTALVIFATLVAIATGQDVGVGVTIERFIIEVAGALALGVAVGLLGSAALSRIDDALLETTITLIMAYGGYLLADRLGVSGPIETATAGLLLGVIGRRVMSPTTRLQAGATWEFIDFLANSLLFLLVGLQVRLIGDPDTPHLGLGLIWPLVVALLAMTLSRAVVAWLVSAVLATRRQALPLTWRAMLVWAGLRGAVSLAAALSLPLALPERDLLLALTFGLVLFTLLAQGLTTGPLLKRLGLAEDQSSPESVEHAVGRLYALNAATREVDTMSEAGALTPQLADELRRHIGQRYEHARSALDAAYQQHPELAQQQAREARQRILHAQREALREAAAQGQISAATLRQLQAEIDERLERGDAPETLLEATPYSP